MDLSYLCAALSDLSGIPVRLYQSGTSAGTFFRLPLPADPAALYLDRLLSIDKNAGYLTDENLAGYGFVRSKNIRIILGPARQTPFSEQEIADLIFRLDIPADENEAFRAAVKNIVPLPLETLLQILCVLDHVLNGEKLTIRDISIYEPELEDLRRQEILRNADKVEKSIPHNTLAIEETIMDLIRHGDTASLADWMQNAPAVRGGMLADEQLRQMKNTFIVTATLASRAAIRGGMDPEDALTLSDQFIRSCELLRAPDKITHLQYHMIREFTERVERLRRGKRPTKLALAAANYVQHHLSEPVSVEGLARELYMSRPYLSARFKKETGQTLTDFFLHEKTEEAKRLLRYTDKTAAQISQYLGFSSQGHFSKAFKKYTGRTPNEYRG